jgi:diguanylate cyclase (GGDEF)-like protein
VVFLILCVAVLNLALGFALAVYLQGARFEWPTGRGISFGLKLLSFAKDPDEALDDPAPVTSEMSVEAPAPAPPLVEAAVDDAVADFDALANSGNEDAADASLAFRSLAAALPANEPTTDEDRTPADDTTGPLEFDDAAVTAAIEGLKSELSLYRGEITTLDARLRQCSAAPDAPTVKACASELQRVNDQYLQQQGIRREELSSQGRTADAASLFRDLAQAMEEQTAAVASAQAELAELDLETDLLAQCRQMLNETRQISQTSERLHATIGDALETLAEDPEDSSAGHEPTTAPSIRQNFVAAVESWWQTNAESGRQLAAALIEPDYLDRLNAEHGPEIVNKALRVLDSIVNGELTAGQSAARPSGDTYLLFLPDASPREAVRFVERCRQQINAMRFRHRGAKFHLTVSCSVAASDRLDDAAPLVARLEAMLAEAKRYGHNRTFFQEGNIPAPAVPPTLSIEPRTIDLDTDAG